MRSPVPSRAGNEKAPPGGGAVPWVAEREGFEPSIGLLTLYSLSRGAPSATRPSLQIVRPAQRSETAGSRVDALRAAEREGWTAPNAGSAGPPLALRVAAPATRACIELADAWFEPSIGLLTRYSLEPRERLQPLGQLSPKRSVRADARPTEHAIIPVRAGLGNRVRPATRIEICDNDVRWPSSVSPHHEPANPVRPGREQRQRGLWVTGSGGRGPPPSSRVANRGRSRDGDARRAARIWPTFSL